MSTVHLSIFVSRWILILFLVHASNIFAACDKCQKPQVIQFDCKIIPPRPSDTTDPALDQKILEWRSLFWVSAGIKGYVFNEDPTKDCFTHLDGSFFTKGDTTSHGITFGEEWANVPPSGGTSGGDYLITGSVNGMGGSYTATAELKVSKTLELVASASVPFTNKDEPITAGRIVASSLGPILDKIRAFEKKKRDGGDPYALQPTAELHPKKSIVKEGESVEVELWLYDCDGTIETSPLKNRPVKITATNGTLSQSTVTTGSDGKVTFTFTAGEKPAEAVLQAIYPFKLASEFESVSNDGSVSIRITEIPSTLWKIRGNIFTQHIYDETVRSSYESITEGSRQTSYVTERYNVNGVLRNITKDTITLFKSDSVPVSFSINGTHTENETSYGFMKMPKAWSKSQHYKNELSTPVVTGDKTARVNFNFFYSPDQKSKSGSLSIFDIDTKGSAKTTGTNCDSENGCKNDDSESDAEGRVDISIAVEKSDSLYKRDTTYTDLSGSNIKLSEHRTITYKDGSFFFEYYYSLDEVQNGSGTVANTSFTSRTFQWHLFEIIPIDKAPSSVHRFGSDRISKNTLSDVKINCRGRFSDVCYTAGKSGVISLKLYNVNGRLLFSGNMSVDKSSIVTRFTTSLAASNSIICAEISFTSPDGSINRAVQTVHNVR
jgi:hypothetical protein